MNPACEKPNIIGCLALRPMHLAFHGAAPFDWVLKTSAVLRCIQMKMTARILTGA